MSIPQSHVERLVSEQLLNGLKAYALHRESRREGMPQVMKSEILDARLFNRPNEDAVLEVVSIEWSGASVVGEDPFAAHTARQFLHHFQHRFRHRNLPSIAALGTRNRDDPVE